LIRRLAERLAWAALVLWFVVTLVFTLMWTLPADPARALAGPHADTATVEQLRRNLCLDRGFVVAYGCHVGRMLRGDLGTSFRTGAPVAEVLAARAGATAQLAGAALLLQLLVGVPLGLWSARWRGRSADLAATGLAAAGGSAPSFVVGPVLMYLLGARLGLFPVSGSGQPGLDRLWHMCLPAVTLAAAGVASYARLVRSALLDVLDEDYLRTARAKGLSEGAVLVRHGLRSALAPILALAGQDLGVLLGGAVITEVVFAWPGFGREALGAIFDLDLPLVLGISLVAAVAVLLATTVVDVATALLDPRTVSETVGGRGD
jgi:peptide/nickel transport system permease protein